MKNKLIVVFMLMSLMFIPQAQAAQASAEMKQSEALGKAAVDNYKNPEINPVEVAGLGLQLFFVDLWKFEPDNKGNNAY